MSSNLILGTRCVDEPILSLVEFCQCQPILSLGDLCQCQPFLSLLKFWQCQAILSLEVPLFVNVSKLMKTCVNVLTCGINIFAFLTNILCSWRQTRRQWAFTKHAISVTWQSQTVKRLLELGLTIHVNVQSFLGHDLFIQERI